MTAHGPYLSSEACLALKNSLILEIAKCASGVMPTLAVQIRSYAPTPSKSYRGAAEFWMCLQISGSTCGFSGVRHFVHPLTLALFGMPIPTAAVEPASTGRITPVIHLA